MEQEPAVKKVSAEQGHARKATGEVGCPTRLDGGKENTKMVLS